jgi:hypothetical protein
MNADAELDAALGRKASVALDHAVLHLDGAAHGVDNAAKLDDASVAGALHYATVMDTDGRGDQIAPERPKPCQRTFLVAAREPAEADHVSGKDSGKLTLFGHWRTGADLRAVMTGRQRFTGRYHGLCKRCSGSTRLTHLLAREDARRCFSAEAQRNPAAPAVTREAEEDWR